MSGLCIAFKNFFCLVGGLFLVLNIWSAELVFNRGILPAIELIGDHLLVGVSLLLYKNMAVFVVF